MTSQNIPCNTFSPVYTNASNNPSTLSLSVTSQCGGVTTLGIYKIGTDELIISQQLQPGLNIIEVQPHQYAAVYCNSSDHGPSGGCIAEYTAS
jgi:hypothetical protein